MIYTKLLLDDVYLADVRTGILVNASQVEKHTGVRCDHVVAMKTLGGCKSDEVPGVSGCGEVSVKWILKNSSSDVPRKKNTRKFTK